MWGFGWKISSGVTSSHTVWIVPSRAEATLCVTPRHKAGKKINVVKLNLSSIINLGGKTSKTTRKNKTKKSHFRSSTAARQCVKEVGGSWRSLGWEWDGFRGSFYHFGGNFVAGRWGKPRNYGSVTFRDPSTTSSCSFIAIFTAENQNKKRNSVIH